MRSWTECYLDQNVEKLVRSRVFLIKAMLSSNTERIVLNTMLGCYENVWATQQELMTKLIEKLINQ